MLDNGALIWSSLWCHRSSGMGQELARSSLPGFEHLNEDLHVLVEFEGDASERDKCLSIASRLVAPLLVCCWSVRLATVPQ